MTQLSLDEKVAQNLVAFHIASPLGRHIRVGIAQEEDEAWRCFHSALYPPCPASWALITQAARTPRNGQIFCLGKDHVLSRLAP